MTFIDLDVRICIDSWCKNIYTLQAVLTCTNNLFWAEICKILEMFTSKIFWFCQLLTTALLESAEEGERPQKWFHGVPLPVPTLFANVAGLGGSVGCAVRLKTRRSRVQSPLRSATFFRGDRSWNIFYGHSLLSCWFKKGSCQFLAKESAQYWLTA